MAEPFTVKDCALIAISTGVYAQTLREFREKLQTIPTSSIYYHFWGGLLRPRFDDPEYQNDFAIWTSRSLHDETLAERLALINPTDYEDLEDLRRELLDVIEERLDESEILPWIRASRRFYFVRSQIVVFDTGRKVYAPENLRDAIPSMSAGSIFYHFIDARRRTETGRDDFTEWLSALGGKARNLAEHVAGMDPYFTNLLVLRDELTQVFETYLKKGAP
jgi:hypothetical protein